MKTILVVDDEILMVKAIRLLLSKEGYRTLSAHNGQDGLQLATHGLPDLILLDIMMPGMNGWDVLKELKSNPETASIPVVVFTAMELFQGKENSLLAGAADYITKPFESDVLLRVLKHVLLQVGISRRV
ncbi:response regulator [bacterium]|nr:response regulator [candidate division CSSED10-310 bacterium]